MVRLLIMIGMLGVVSIFVRQSPAGEATKEYCKGYVGKSIHPVTFDDVVDAIPKIEPRGEFETTEAYKERVRQQMASVPREWIISQPVDRRYLKYDPDKQRMKVMKSAIVGDYYFEAWYPLFDYKDLLHVSAISFGNVRYVISHTEEPIGTYEAKNAFGVKATVQKSVVHVQAVFDRGLPNSETSLDEDALFPHATQDKEFHTVVGAWHVPVEKAKSLKNEIEAAYFIRLRESPPYVVRKMRRTREPTITVPREVWEDATVLIADIRCAFLADSENVVIAAYPTR